MFTAEIPRTMKQIRDAIEKQKQLGVYQATEREIPFGTWVWVTKYVTGVGTCNILGAIIEISKYRQRGSRFEQGPMVRNYVILTTRGQITEQRESMVLATADEVRNASGLTAEEDFREAIFEAIENGPSEANTERAQAAYNMLLKEGPWMIGVPRYRGACPCSLCTMKISVVAGFLPEVILTGKWD